jgi:UPF0755 protein
MNPVSELFNRITARLKNPVWAGVFLSVLVLLAVLYGTLYRAPSNFPVLTPVSVPEGLSLSEAASLLEEENVIRSSFALRTLVVLAGGEKSITAGDYIFNARRGLFRVARALVTGDFGLEPIRVTIPEGATIRDIGSILSSKVASFDREEFLVLAEGKEGYLFPDTYIFYSTTKAADAILLMERTFGRRIAGVRADIIRFGRPLEEVIIMASLLEKEAPLYETRRTIAGILWKRLDEGFPLQVDATFLYINGKNTFELTRDDLEIDSPYNTYRYVGLPQGPIANPGLDAVLAAISPIETDYYYYLSDKDGVTHFSKTFEEHKEKKQKYLN